MAVAFDEMNGPGGDLRPAYQELSRWLKETPPDALEYRRQEAELLFRRIGITFAVYGDAEAQERLIPFDVIPRIMSAKEWIVLEKGLKQRVRALNMFLRDIYHGRDILRANIIPDDLIFQNPVFRPEMNGQSVPHDVYVHIAGIDIVRVDADNFIVLEDNARTPSGVSYMLENREIMMRLFPDLFARHRVAPVEKYPDELLVGAALGGAAERFRRADGRADDARRLQFRLLRALVPRRQARHRTGRGPRPHRQERRGVHAHHRGAEARRRDLPPRRRRLPRSPDLPPRFRARRARADVGLRGRQHHAGERGRHRHRRRQGGLFLHARDREVLSQRRADPEERADLALPRAQGPRPMCSTISASSW